MEERQKALRRERVALKKDVKRIGRGSTRGRPERPSIFFTKRHASAGHGLALVRA
jgi:hypothetical protein